MDYGPRCQVVSSVAAVSALASESCTCDPAGTGAV